MARHDVREVLAPDLPMDPSSDAELMLPACREGCMGGGRKGLLFNYEL